MSITEIIKKKYNDLIDLNFLLFIHNQIFNNLDPKYLLKIYNIENAYEDYHLHLNICSIIIANHRFNMLLISPENQIKLMQNPDYIKKLVDECYCQIIYSSQNTLEVSSSIFLEHPAISITLTIASFIKKQIAALNFAELSNDSKDLIILIENALDTLISTFTLLNISSYHQAISIFRQYLEQTIILSALDKYPVAIPSFKHHQNLTIKDALNIDKKIVADFLKERYIKEYESKSYLNYGWLDSIEDFQKIPNHKYNVKQIAILAEVEPLYECLADASNYVHSNLVFANLDWNTIINSTVTYSMVTIETYIDMFTKITNQKLVLYDIDLFKILENNYQRLTNPFTLSTKIVTPLSIDNLEEASEIVFNLNNVPKTSCRVCPKKRNEITAYLKKMLTNSKDFILGYFEDKKLIGVLGILVEKEANYLQAVCGPFVNGNFEIVSNEFIKYLSGKLPNFTIDFVIPIENIMATYWLENINFKKISDKVEILSSAKSFLSEKPKSEINIKKLERKYYNDFITYHNNLNPDVYWSGERLIKALNKFNVYLALLDDSIVGSIIISNFSNEREEIYFINSNNNDQNIWFDLILKVSLIHNNLKFTLLVDKSEHSALEFYKSIGFKVIGTNQTYRSKLNQA